MKISIRTAKLAKKKDFWIKGVRTFKIVGTPMMRTFWKYSSSESPKQYRRRVKKIFDKDPILVLQPTQYELLDWLRKKHGIYISVEPYLDLYGNTYYEWNLLYNNIKEEDITEFVAEKHKTYEKALEAGLYHGLKFVS